MISWSAAGAVSMISPKPAIGSARIDVRASSSRARSASASPVRASPSAAATSWSTCWPTSSSVSGAAPSPIAQAWTRSGMARCERQDVGRAAAPAVHGHAADAEMVEDRGEVVRVLDEAPARESRRDAEPGALDGDHPQSALAPMVPGRSAARGVTPACPAGEARGGPRGARTRSRRRSCRRGERACLHARRSCSHSQDRTWSSSGLRATGRTPRLGRRSDWPVTLPRLTRVGDHRREWLLSTLSAGRQQALRRDGRKRPAAATMDVP